MGGGGRGGVGGLRPEAGRPVAVCKGHITTPLPSLFPYLGLPPK